MRKPRVLFPYTEAGLGHIMPMNAIAEKFEALYGDRVECVRSSFFQEGNKEELIEFENRLCSTVVKANKSPSFGFFMTFNMDFWGIRLSSWATMKFLKLGANKLGFEHMEELKPDLVVSTHWATNYYAEHMENKPLTAMYCPDADINPLFSYPCDLAMVSMEPGYEHARKRFGKRFNDENLKCVPYLIREEAFSVSTDKRALRRKFGFNEDKFTVILAEGGYGVGTMAQICEKVIERDLPVTLVPVCGKNEELYRELLTWKVSGKTEFRPIGFTDQMLELLSASDLFCGKSGANVIAEACFFGLPQIITHYATNIEKSIGAYYIENVGSAMKIFNPEKVVDKLEEILQDPAVLNPYRAAALAQKKNYGAEACARYIFDLLCTRFPELKEGEKKVNS
jgi:UDP-N-acetylglucosamine:LPS N-acetylglucosamine transferase